MKKIVIEKGVPFPVDVEFPNKSVMKALASMDVGDSMIDPRDVSERGTKINNLCDKVSKSHGYKFCTRSTDKGMRIWRVS